MFRHHLKTLMPLPRIFELKVRYAGVVSSDRSNTGVKFLCWGLVLQGLSGRSLSWRATALSLAWLKPDISVPFGKYLRSNRLVFSLLPRCQGDCGSQK